MRGGTFARRLALAALVAFFGISTGQAMAQVLTVTPDTGLPESTTVQVSGNGFAPGFVAYQQCTEDGAGDLRCKIPGQATSANASGNFGPVSLPVSRTFTDGGTWDCRIVTCFVYAADTDGREARHNIAFAPPTQPLSTGTSTETGLRAAALAKCKQKRKKLDWSKKRYRKCKNQANQLPV
jgi:hypothetical protein